MSLSDEIRAWQEQMLSLLKEGETMLRHATELEQQNMSLQQRLVEKPGAGFEALTGLYDEGFHICPKLFGQEREGEECLFCLNFLLHKGKKE